jgi:predicted RNase H-like HicB family nuclease
MTYFVGILDGGDDTWGVRVPDCPGCHGAGATVEAAIADVLAAMREWAQHHETAGRTLPAARTVREIVDDPETAFDPGSGEATVMLPLVLDKQRLVKANISMDAGTLEAIDAAAKQLGLTRSAFLASAAVDKITHMR